VVARRPVDRRAPAGPRPWGPGTRPVHLGLQEPCEHGGACPTSTAGSRSRGAAPRGPISGSSPSTETVDLRVATTASPARIGMVDEAMHCAEGCDGSQGSFLHDLHGHGDLVYDGWTECGPSNPKNGPADCVPNGELSGRTSIEDERLWRVEGARRVQARSGKGSVWVADVDAGRIVLREVSGAVDVLRADGSLVQRLVLPAGQALAARLSGSQLVVLTKTTLDVYDAATGAAQRTVPLGRADQCEAR
jgi:hypothetical protein